MAGPLATLEEFKKLKKVPVKKKPSTANVESTGKSTVIGMEKKAKPSPNLKVNQLKKQVHHLQLVQLSMQLLLLQEKQVNLHLP